MRLLFHQEGEAGLVDLEEAWTSPDTFVFLPSRSGGRESWITEALEKVPDALRRDHFALFSSGSTGEPKIVFGSRDRSVALAKVLHEVQNGEPVRRTLGLLPLTYSYAFVNQWLWARVHAREYTWTAGLSDPVHTCEALAAARDAMLCLVAGQLPLLESHLGRRAFPGVIRLHFAGSRFPQTRLREIRRMFPEATIYNNYGCVEAMPRLCARKAEEADSASDVGRPLPGVELRTDEEGRLLFRSPYGAVGFCDSDGYHAIAPGDWTFTGDRGHQETGGRWLLDGRSSEVFKRYGEKISLPMLLESLTAGWRGQGAFYRETDAFGEAGHVLLLAPKPEADELRSILTVLRHDYARTHWPLRIESVSELPTLPNGKIDSDGARSLPERSVEWNQRIG